MTGTTRVFPAFVLAASAVVLGGALLSQHWGGLAPCGLCLLQRWPWGVAIVISFVATMVGRRVAVPWAAPLLAAASAGGPWAAFYPGGAEEPWFAGPPALRR